MTFLERLQKMARRGADLFNEYLPTNRLIYLGVFTLAVAILSGILVATSIWSIPVAALSIVGSFLSCVITMIARKCCTSQPSTNSTNSAVNQGMSEAEMSKALGVNHEQPHIATQERASQPTMPKHTGIEQSLKQLEEQTDTLAARMDSIKQQTDTLAVSITATEQALDLAQEIVTLLDKLPQNIKRGFPDYLKDANEFFDHYKDGLSPMGVLKSRFSVTGQDYTLIEEKFTAFQEKFVIANDNLNKTREREIDENKRMQSETDKEKAREIRMGVTSDFAHSLTNQGSTGMRF